MDPVSKAQSTQPNSRAAHLAKHKWQPGQSGNPGGRPVKKPITEIYEKILRRSKNRKAIEDTVVKLILGGRMSSVLQLREMAERTEGKVVQPVEMGGNLTISLEQVLEAKKKAGK
jgi:hypothetical protein